MPISPLSSLKATILALTPLLIVGATLPTTAVIASMLLPVR